MITALAIIFACAWLFTLFLLMRLHRSLRKLKAGADAMAVGAMGNKIHVPGPRAASDMARSLNEMADLLQQRVQQVLEQRNELAAVFASMDEGILAVDLNERVIRMNASAGRQLEMDPGSALGRNIEEVARHSALLKLVKDSLKKNERLVADTYFLANAERRHIEARASPLASAGGHRIGSLIILLDITRIRKLENLRRDFVANVSHELKTPVTAIRGFVETMLDDPDMPHEDLTRFLNIISHQSERLGNLVEDLLSLARIEQDAEQRRIALETAFVSDVLHLAIEGCSPLAEQKGVRLELSCDPDLEAQINPPLLEQAVINLITNAVKYSPENSAVLISAQPEAKGGIAIAVTDQGMGIESSHQPRLFERFYRVDRARSRDEGGTGLGLAIVKHVAQAHQGTVSVESELGQGSTFRIHLPAPEAVVAQVATATTGSGM